MFMEYIENAAINDDNVKYEVEPGVYSSFPPGPALPRPNPQCKVTHIFKLILLLHNVPAHIAAAVLTFVLNVLNYSNIHR